MAGEYICVGMTVRVRPTDGPQSTLASYSIQRADEMMSQMMEMGRGTP